MENELKFETDQFGVNPEGIHLLRSKFIYKTIPYDEIQSSVIKNGREYKNWVIMLIIGLASIAFAINHIYNLWNFFHSPEGGVIYIESLIVPFFPTIIGLLLIYLSLRNTLILNIMTLQKNHTLSLRPLIRKNVISEFEKYLKSQISGLTVHVEK